MNTLQLLFRCCVIDHKKKKNFRNFVNNAPFKDYVGLC